ncbi:fibronectin type III domain-containing protein [Actinoplanes sp. NPDC051343]|uniref:fibronectin type III domain-containing protein n=1 Tax=Actinoplanes sp. NPDC051343 TaxID=3363906 RepID=UPI0037A3A1B2
MLVVAVTVAAAVTSGVAAQAAGGQGPAPRGLRVPALAYDDESVTLAWQPPPSASGIVDYRVYRDGVPVGTAGQAAAGAASGYIRRFYAEPGNSAQVRIATTSYTARGLRPSTRYRFSVRALYADGTESAASATIEQSTAAPLKVYNVVDYGAVGDGTTLNTVAIQRAIDACRGGCKVLVPAGTFKTGAIWLHSDMTLQVASGGRLLGSDRAEDYPYHYLLYQYSTDERFYSLINAHTYDYGSLHDIRIVGPGTIDGNGWKQTGVDADGNPLYAKGSASTVSSTGLLAAAQVVDAAALGSPSPYPTRSNLITLRGVTGVYLGGFTAQNPSNHTMSLIRDADVTVDGVNIQTLDVNNGDGVEWINSNGLTVMNTVFNTGDDCMNFAAGLGAAASDDPPAQNAWIFDNYFARGHGAVVLGSHTGAWIQNIVAENNVINGTDVGLRMKTVPTNGGGGRNVVFRDTAIKATTAEAFVFTSAYNDANAAITVEPAATPARFEDVEVDHVTVDGTAGPSIHVVGVAGAEHRDLHFTDVRLLTARPTSISYLAASSFRDVTFDNTPDPWMISNSTGLSFTGATTTDAVSADAASGPRWPAGAAVTVTGATDTSTTLSWPAASDTVAVAGYRVLRDGAVVATAPAGAAGVTVTGLAPALRYSFAVQAVDATGNATRDLLATATTTGTRDKVAPVATGTFSVAPGSAGYTWMRLTWQAATDNYGVAGYVVTANGRRIGRVDATTTSFVATGLTAGTTYRFGLSAVDATGNSTAYATTAQATTLPPYDTGAPAWSSPHPPLTMRAVGPTSATVSWPPARDDKGVTGYRVLVDGVPAGTGDFTPISTTATTTGTTYTVTGLAAGARHTIGIEAGDAMGRWSGPHPTAVVTTTG